MSSKGSRRTADRDRAATAPEEEAMSLEERVAKLEAELALARQQAAESGEKAAEKSQGKASDASQGRSNDQGNGKSKGASNGKSAEASNGNGQRPARPAPEAKAPAGKKPAPSASKPEAKPSARDARPKKSRPPEKASEKASDAKAAVPSPPPAPQQKSKPSAGEAKPAKASGGKPSAGSKAAAATAPAGLLVEETEEERSTLREALKRMPAWTTSMIVHAVIVIMLAVFTVQFPDNDDSRGIVAANTEELSDELEEIQEVEVEVDELNEPTQFQAQAVDLSTAVDLGEVGTLDDGNIGDIGAPDVGLADVMGIGKMGEVGLGGSGKASFFGVVTQGNRFCFVVDNSNSMNGGKFETACYELLKSVSNLSEEQYFYVIFYSDTAYPLFYPEPARGMVRATEENKRKLGYWLETVHRCLRTDGEEAMAMALTMRPDVIYLIGDGAFTDKTAQKTLAINVSGLTMHTLGFRMRPKDAETFGQIAAKFNGKFTEVDVTPQMQALSKQKKRPLNNSQNGVWGIKLGKKKK